MRKLAIAAFSFALGALLSITLLPNVWKWVACVCLLAIFALSRLLHGRTAVAIFCAALPLGILYSAAYEQLLFLPAEQNLGTTQAVVLELTDYPVQGSYQYYAEARMEQNGRTVSAKIFSDELKELKPGDRVEGTVEFYEDDGAGTQNRANGCVLAGSLREITAVLPTEALPWWAYPKAAARTIRTRISALFSEKAAGFVKALLTGDRTGLSYEDQNRLKLAGLYHTVAVSGMHVSILMSALFVLIRRRRLVPVIAAPILLFFIVMTGGAPSVLRAGIMQLFAFLAILTYRDYDSLTALGAALLLLTLQNPWLTVNLGLLLSFLATAGILLLGAPLNERLSGTVRKLPKLLRKPAGLLCSTLAISSGALIFTTPLMAYSYGMISVLCLLSNVLCLWAVSLCFILGAAACALSYVWMPLGVVLAFPVNLLSRYFFAVCGAAASLPFANLYLTTAYPYVFLALCYLLLLLFFCSEQKRRQAVILGCCGIWALLLTLFAVYHDADGRAFTFTALDVGQGQCLVLRSGNASAMIDCGGSEDEGAGETAARYLQANGLTRLNYLILTHYDEDHTGGVAQLLQRISVGTLFLPDVEDDNGVKEQLIEAATQAGTALREVRTDYRISFEQGTLQIFAPVCEDGSNESCLSVLSSFGTYDILVTGDLPEAEEETLLTLHPMENVELLVAGHHGAATSTGHALLSAVTPELVVISVGENRYGHPREETLNRIAAAGAKCLRTDRNGNITVWR